MNTPVSFEIAKLLKEKGFNSVCEQVYRSDGFFYTPRISGGKIMHSNILEDESYSAPTIAEVVMWLLEKCRLDIIIKYPESTTNKIEGINSVYYDLEIYRLQSGDAYKIYKRLQCSDEKADAYSIGIEYCLKELI
jgi:hypothetical protein